MTQGVAGGREAKKINASRIQRFCRDFNVSCRMRQGENTEFAWENVNVIQSEIAIVQWLTHV